LASTKERKGKTDRRRFFFMMLCLMMILGETNDGEDIVLIA
jgi:hypothetical protein